MLACVFWDILGHVAYPRRGREPATPRQVAVFNVDTCLGNAQRRVKNGLCITSSRDSYHVPRCDKISIVDMCGLIWCFPKTGVPLVIIHFNGFSHYICHPFFAVPPFMETPQMLFLVVSNVLISTHFGWLVVLAAGRCYSATIQPHLDHRIVTAWQLWWVHPFFDGRTIDHTWGFP